MIEVYVLVGSRWLYDSGHKTQKDAKARAIVMIGHSFDGVKLVKPKKVCK